VNAKYAVGFSPCLPAEPEELVAAFEIADRL
jgi:hypothetical protein